jgi:hypothetical protein
MGSDRSRPAARRLKIELVERLALLDPTLSFYGCFDADPAGMSPRLLEQAETTQELNDWDRDLLLRVLGRLGCSSRCAKRSRVSPRKASRRSTNAICSISSARVTLAS